MPTRSKHLNKRTSFTPWKARTVCWKKNWSRWQKIRLCWSPPMKRRNYCAKNCNNKSMIYTNSIDERRTGYVRQWSRSSILSTSSPLGTKGVEPPSQTTGTIGWKSSRDAGFDHFCEWDQETLSQTSEEWNRGEETAIRLSRISGESDILIEKTCSKVGAFLSDGPPAANSRFNRTFARRWRWIQSSLS